MTLHLLYSRLHFPPPLCRERFTFHRLHQPFLHQLLPLPSFLPDHTAIPFRSATFWPIPTTVCKAVPPFSPLDLSAASEYGTNRKGRKVSCAADCLQTVAVRWRRRIPSQKQRTVRRWPKEDFPLAAHARTRAQTPTSARYFLFSTWAGGLVGVGMDGISLFFFRPLCLFHLRTKQQPREGRKLEVAAAAACCC